MKTFQRADVLLVLGLVVLLIIGCKPDRDRDTAKLDLRTWTKEFKEKGTVFYNDSSWVFLYDSLNIAKDRRDTVIFGPYKGHPPILDQFEFFEGDPLDDKDDKWVIEYLGPDGCVVVTFGFKDGKITLYHTYLMKDSNCGSSSFDEDLKRKTILGPKYANDSIRALVINYDTGELIGSGTTAYGDFRDVELLKGYFVKIRQGDSVYVEVDVTTDIKSRYAFPGTFVRARENGDGCKVMVVKNGDGYFSYVICPHTPNTHISIGDFMYGDSLTDVQAHSIEDTVRFVVATYDKQNKTTRIDVIDTNATRKVERILYGNWNTAKLFCNKRIKAFVLEDTLAENGEGKIYLDAIHLTKDRVKEFVPKEIRGRVVSVDTLADPCGLRIRYKEANGAVVSRDVFFN